MSKNDIACFVLPNKKIEHLGNWTSSITCQIFAMTVAFWKLLTYIEVIYHKLCTSTNHKFIELVSQCISYMRCWRKIHKITLGIQHVIEWVHSPVPSYSNINVDQTRKPGNCWHQQHCCPYWNEEKIACIWILVTHHYHAK